MLGHFVLITTSLYQKFIGLTPLQKVGAVGVGALAAWVFRLFLKYRREIQKRLKQLEEDSRKLMVRADPALLTKGSQNKFRLIELNPRFVEEHKQHWRLTSLGDYLSSLRPAILPKDVELPILIQRELETLLGMILLRSLGPRFGGVMLPAIGNVSIQARLEAIASAAASWWANHFRSNSPKPVEDKTDRDRGILPMTLLQIIDLLNMNEGAKGIPMSTPPLNLFKDGEVGYKPSFGDHPTTPEGKASAGDLIPNPFIVSEHWDAAIAGMENLIKSQLTGQETHDTPMAEARPVAEGTVYDPHDRSYPEPTPVHKALFPDLHLGWGKASCTHSKREVIRNRLLCVLLNRLGFNYYSFEADNESLFVLKMKKDGPSIMRPQHFVQALMDAGHSVSVCPRTTLTTFGTALSIKEKDGGWSNIPLAFFLHSGYEDKTGKAAALALPHGGLDLDIEGPLVGTDENGKSCRCNIQHYIAIEGLCGWHSNHNADVPWVRAVNCADPYDEKMMLHAVRMAALNALVMNAVATEKQLPLGGYGLTGVCNDTAGMIDTALRGTTNVHPFTSTGRFLMHLRRRMKTLKDKLAEQKDLGEEVRDLEKLMDSTLQVGSDLDTSPANAADTSRRMIKCLPEGEPCFQMMVDAKKIMTTINEELNSY